MSSIEREIAETTRAVAELEAAALATLGLATRAVHSNDDGALRTHLIGLQGQFEKLEALRGDLTILRELLNTCRAFAKQQSTETPREVDA